MPILITMNTEKEILSEVFSGMMIAMIALLSGRGTTPKERMKSIEDCISENSKSALALTSAWEFIGLLADITLDNCEQLGDQK